MHWIHQFRQTVWPAVSVIGAIIAVGALILDGIDVLSLGLPAWAWQSIGASIFAIALLAIALNPQRVGARNEAVASQPPASSESMQTARDTSEEEVEFYPHRPSIEWYGRQLQEAGKVNVLWNTGSILRDLKVLQRRMENLERIILPHPSSPFLEALAEAAGDSRAELEQKISNVTQEAIYLGTDIRWWSGLAGNLMTISEDWVLVESFVPFLAAGERPQYRVNRKDHPELYDRLYRAYKEIWRKSVEPPKPG